MKVTAVIPNFNHGKYLVQRIESVIRQTYPELGIVILDDCSSDESREIISRYRNHPRIESVIFNDSNSGSPFRQWKKGVEVSGGQLIWIAESDDSADPDFLKRVVVPFLTDRDHKISFCYCNSNVIDSKGTLLGEYYYLNAIKGPASGLPSSSDEFIRKYLLHSNAVPNASAVVFRKELSLTLFDEVSGYKINGDWLFWLHLASRGMVVFFDEALNYFRTHDANVRSVTYQNGVFLPEYFAVQRQAAQLAGLNARERRALKYNMLNRFYREVIYNQIQVSSAIRKECFSIINSVSQGVRWPAIRTRIRLALDRKMKFSA